MILTADKTARPSDGRCPRQCGGRPVAGDLPVARLRSLISYDAETGLLTWLARALSEFQSARSWRMWNTRYAGKAALNYVSPAGYKTGTVDGCHILAHRACWALATGEWPENHLDHVNGDRPDNRFENLREATRTINARNQKRHSTNTSGVSGVCWIESRQKWSASIYDGHRQFLGHFTAFRDAVAARAAAEAALAYHPNHGRTR